MAWGAQRRRRRDIERRLRQLDRLDQRDRTVAWSATHARRRIDIRGLVALVMAAALTLALISTVPGIAPVWLRKAIGMGPHRLAPTVAAPNNPSFAFLVHQPEDPSEPVAWDPCRPIHYEINPAGGPPGALGLVEQAVARASAVTGLEFTYDGETDARPQWHSEMAPILGRGKPVLISWATEDEVAELAGRVAGIGGSLPVPAGGGRLRYATGGVTLDSASFNALAARPGGAAEERAIVLHELGHVVGLAHVQDPAELMNADNVGLLDYGPGDLAGLARLGSGHCY